MCDQALTGGANLIAMAAFARLLPQPAFGALGAAIAVHFFIFGVHRSLLVLPFILSAKDGRTIRDQSGWAWLAVWSSLALAAMLSAASLASGALGAGTFTQHLLIAAALQSPPLLLQEFQKRWLYQAERSAAVIASSAVSITVMIIGVAAFAALRPPPLFASMVLGLSALLGAIYGFVQLPPSFRRVLGPFWPLLRPRARLAGWQFVTNIPYTIYNNGYPLLLAAVAGPGVTASFTAIRTILSPSASLISAVDSTDKLRAARAFADGGVDAAKRSVDQTRRFLLAFNLPFLVACAVLAGPLLHFVMAGKYPHAVEAAVLAGYFLLLTVNQPFETFLLVQERGSTLFASRLLSAAVAVAGTLVLAPRYGLLGAVIAPVLAQVVNCAALWLLSRREIRRRG